MNFIRWVVGACFIILCVIFAVSNRHLINFYFWPFPFAFPVQAGLAILLPAFITFLLGGLWASLSKTKLWARARQTEKQVVQLKSKLQDIQEQLRQTETRTYGESRDRQTVPTQNSLQSRQQQNQ